MSKLNDQNMSSCIGYVGNVNAQQLSVLSLFELESHRGQSSHIAFRHSQIKLIGTIAK